MTDVDRTETILKSVQWWDADQMVAAARAWYLDWHPEIGRFPVSQWESARRVGTGVESYTKFQEAWQEFLWGREGPNGERKGGAVDRDKKRRTWAHPLLADDLQMAISRASEPDGSERAHAFDNEAQKLGPKAASRLQDWRRLRQARLFLDFLLMLIRAEWDPKEKK